jgi:hypothetical protein
MKAKKRISILIGITSILILSGCIVKDSPAPGCRKTIGIPMMGGCFGKTVLQDLELISVPDCLEIRSNNCNGGILEINNTCSEAIQLDGVEILPASSISLDIKEADGSFELIPATGNFSQYAPDVDKNIEVTGIFGSQSIELTFTKTSPLCE